jgi:hypothetical protein
MLFLISGCLQVCSDVHPNPSAALAITAQNLNIGLLEIYIQAYLRQPASKKQATPAVGNVVADVNGKKVT